MCKKPAVLLVDDEPDMLASLVGLLRREFLLHTAQSGEQALDILAANDIHVLMTDQRMPGMTGSALLQKVCERGHSPALMLFTGYADIRSVIDAVNTGRLFRYITKPWDPDELIELLHTATEEYKRIAANQRLRECAREYASLGRSLAEQVRSAGSGASGGELTPFIHACDQLVELGSTFRVPDTGG